MLHPQVASQLEKLSKEIKAGNLTPAETVGPGTFICFTQATPFGMAYAQAPYDTAPLHVAELLKGRKKGEKVGDLKIVAVFDMWPEMEGTKAPPVQVFDN